MTPADRDRPNEVADLFSALSDPAPAENKVLVGRADELYCDELAPAEDGILRIAHAVPTITAPAISSKTSSPEPERLQHQGRRRAKVSVQSDTPWGLMANTSAIRHYVTFEWLVLIDLRATWRSVRDACIRRDGTRVTAPRQGASPNVLGAQRGHRPAVERSRREPLVRREPRCDDKQRLDRRRDAGRRLMGHIAIASMVIIALHTSAIAPYGRVRWQVLNAERNQVRVMRLTRPR